MPTTTRAIHRRAAIIHPIAAILLATLMGLLAVWPTIHWPRLATVGPVTGFSVLEVGLAVLATALIGAVIVLANRTPAAAMRAAAAPEATGRSTRNSRKEVITRVLVRLRLHHEQQGRVRRPHGVLPGQVTGLLPGG